MNATAVDALSPERMEELRQDAQLGKQLVAILFRHCGQRGDNEGAVQTLQRIIRERDDARQIGVADVHDMVRRLAARAGGAEQWAKKIGVSRALVYKVLDGTRRPGTRMLRALGLTRQMTYASRVSSAPSPGVK